MPKDFAFRDPVNVPLPLRTAVHLVRFDESVAYLSDGPVLQEVEAMFAGSYLRCPDCQIVFDDADGKFSAAETPAPCCGASGTRRIWPRVQAVKLLEIFEAQDVTKPDEHRVAILFFASALEVMLEEVLVEELRLRTTSEALREAILDSHEGVERRRKLFARLSGTALGKLLPDKSGQEFLSDWKTLARRRNRVAHGAYHFPDSNDVVLMHRMRGSYLRAFMTMHNDVTRRSAASQLAK